MGKINPIDFNSISQEIKNKSADQLLNDAMDQLANKFKQIDELVASAHDWMDEYSDPKVALGSFYIQSMEGITGLEIDPEQVVGSLLCAVWRIAEMKRADLSQVVDGSSRQGGLRSGKTQ